jgi:hypothetical protein
LNYVSFMYIYYKITMNKNWIYTQQNNSHYTFCVIILFIYYVSPSYEGRHIVLVWFFLPLLLLLSEAFLDHNLLAHLAFRPGELLSSLFIRRPSVNISHFNLLLRNHWANCNQPLVGWPPSKIVSGDPNFQPRWPPS